MSNQIIHSKEEVMNTLTKEIHTVTIQVKEVESKTQDVVREVLYNEGPPSKAARRRASSRCRRT